VLLKNAGQTLPLKKSGSIALVGPLAADQRNLLGSWSAAGDWKKAVSVADGISHAAPGLSVLQAKGANLVDDPTMLQELNASGGDIAPDKRSARVMIE